MADTPARRRPPAMTLVVQRTEWLTPHMVRVVLGGTDVDRFVDNGFTDRYVKLAFPRPGGDERPWMRTYTVRRYDPVQGELAIDFVVHGDAGVAAPWAAAARPGDELTVMGPGGAYAPRSDVDWHLLVGDEAALPAIAAALEAMPAGAPVRALIEVAGPDDEQPLASPGELDLAWLHRDGAGYRHGEDFVAAVRALTMLPGRVQAFVHGELGAMRELRPHLLHERGIPPELLSLSGYWRRGKDEDGFQAEKAEDAARERAGAG